MIFALLILFSPEVKSQVKVNVKGKVNNEADRRANNATDRAIDAGFDKLEQGIKVVFKKKDKTAKTEGKSDEAEEVATEPDKPANAGNEAVKDTKKQASEADAAAKGPALAWSKYDFVPGDQVIFEDNLQNEQNGEFPSRWDLV